MTAVQNIVARDDYPHFLSFLKLVKRLRKVSMLYALLVAATLCVLTPDSVSPATIKSAVDCGAYPCLVFEDNFDDFDLDTWEHEIQAGNSGVSYTRYRAVTVG